MKTAEVVEALGALASETRLEVLRLLVRAGPGGLPAGEIARRLKVPAPTLSFHLRALHATRLVGSRREGRSVLYFVDFEVMGGVVRFLTENCCSEGRSPARRRTGRAGA
ncbi:MAG: metalloregulator ArsR/SmtB family transcription factor [Myxococcota bacterium]|nr:metalloregulator ArsR/SmtB family transcription factor [Myxococcota bacterium]